LNIFRGKHGKVTDLMKAEMKKLRDEGETFTEIGKILDLSSSTIQYHLSPTTREKVKERVYKCREKLGSYSQQYPEQRRRYMREYMKERYNSDPEFKERMKGHMKNYYEKQKLIHLTEEA